MLLAIFLSCIFKNPDADEDEDTNEDDEEELELQYDEEWLHPRDEDGNLIYNTKGRTRGYAPPPTAELAAARDYRMKELQMYKIVKELLAYFFFLWIVIVLSYGVRDPNGYLMRTSHWNYFTAPGDWYNDFKITKNVTQYWNWTLNVLGPNLRVDNWYNDDPPYYQRGMIGDRVSRLLGYAVMRQVRTRPDSCEISEKVERFLTKSCKSEANIFKEEDRDFAVKWKLQGAHASSRSEYKYRTSNELNGYPEIGLVGSYGGGGYVAELRGTTDEVISRLTTLRDENWIDSYTRAVFVEFSTYNAFVNMFIIARILVELPAGGGLVTNERFDPVSLLTDDWNFGLFKLICEILYVIYIAFYTFREVRVLTKLKKKYFHVFWNWVEVAILLQSYICFGIYIYRMIVMNEVVEIFQRTHGLGYVKLQYVGYWSELYMYMVSFIMFLATIKFIKLLRFNKRMSYLAGTLSKCGKDLVAFLVMWAIVFFAFVQVFYFCLSNHMTDFNNFISATESTMSMMLGKFRFNELRMASPILGPLFFCLFIIMCTFILVNMFLTLIVQTFTDVKHDVAKRANEYEILDFIMQRFMMWSGMGNAGLHAVKVSTKLSEEERRKQDVETFPERVDELLDQISRVYFGTERFEYSNVRQEEEAKRRAQLEQDKTKKKKQMQELEKQLKDI